MIDFSPLWKTLKKKGISTYCLINDYHLSKGTIDSLKHNRNVTLNTIDNLCQILQVPIEEIVNITYDQDTSWNNFPSIKRYRGHFFTHFCHFKILFIKAVSFYIRILFYYPIIHLNIIFNLQIKEKSFFLYSLYPVSWVCSRHIF